MIKQTIKLLALSLLLLLVALPAKADQFGDFGYTTNGGTVAITNYTGAGGVVVIPADINGLPVASIGDGAFPVRIGYHVGGPGGEGPTYLNTNLTEVIIPISVTNIGNSAFDSCINLTNVTIGDNVTSVGSKSFLGCSKLANLTIPNSVTNIGNYAFYGCSSLTSAAIGNSIANIGDGAFQSCTQLTSVTIPNSVTNIGSSVFQSCSGLTNVMIGNSVTSLGDAAFQSCFGLTSLTIPDSVTSIGSSAFQYCGSLTNITIGTNVTSIGDLAFWGCVKVDGITIPGNVTNIGFVAFANCYSLTNVTIPSGVISIGEGAFYDCTNLTAITVDETNPSYSSADGVLFNKDKTILIQFPGGKTGSYAVPNGVASIGKRAFGVNDGSGIYRFYSSCPSLHSITIPGSVTNIGDYAFSHCDGLNSVTLSNGLVSLGIEAFSGCTSLTSLSIPTTVTSIGDGAFYYCNLISVTIPGSVTNFGAGAFAVCLSLASVTIQDGVTGIGNYAFQYCPDLTSITIPGSVINIGDLAFNECTGLTNITLLNGIISIGTSVFSSCTNLTSITIPASVTSISSGAFSGWNTMLAITVDAANASYSILDGVLFNKEQTRLIKFLFGGGGSYVVPSSVTNIESNAFNGCASLTNLTLLNGVTSIGDWAFANCANLTSVTISASVTSIEILAFANCTSLTSVYFQGNAPIAGWEVFGGGVNATVYYLLGTTGWGSTYAGRPAVPQNSQAIVNGMFLFNFNGLAGSNYVIQVSSNLTDWVNLVTNVIPASGGRVFDFPIRSNQSKMFYRALPLAQGQVVLQPGPVDSQDIWTTSVYSYADGTGPGTGGGLNDHRLRVGGWDDEYDSLIQFNLAGLPTNATSAVLYLYCYNLSGGGTPLYFDGVTSG